MQTRPMSRLARKMASYARKHSLSQTAEKFSILDPLGQPSRQLTRLLINGYEPRRAQTRGRLGLPVEIKIPAPKRTINDHLANDPIQDMPAPLLEYALTNREEIQ
jgi:hypothetical protein